LPTSTPAPTATATPLPLPAQCPARPPPWWFPPLGRDPGYTQLTLPPTCITGRSFEVIDLDSYRLEVRGLVDRPPA
jgi:hypothetical protein